jgi:(R,R)-butanediol dehydrogenase/meso-butanediol dehydrogenase/diacetyl reductase
MLSLPGCPTIVGHEFTGIVREVHPSVTTIKPGARAVILPADGDDSCQMCVRGCHSSCEHLKIYGYQSNGGLTDLATVKASMCFELPDTIPFDIGALIEPLAVAWNAIEGSGFQPATHRALVIGTGTIGLGTIACLVAMGVEPSRIMVVGRNAMRNEKAREYGIDNVYSSTDLNLVQKAKDLFEGHAVNTPHQIAIR